MRKITTTDFDKFIDIIFELTMQGMNFEANADDLTITLIGVY